MGSFLEELEKIFHSRPLPVDNLDDSQVLVFDDEPLERLNDNLKLTHCDNRKLTHPSV
jgi:hypothetical protein